MAKTYNILAVKRLYRVDWATRKKVRYYQVTVNDVPGHNVITLPYWNFDGVPSVNAKMESTRTLNPYDRLLWRVKKQNKNENIK